jgi:hypothetical protein
MGILGHDTVEQYLRNELEGLVYWRGNVAERYPEDDRNAEAVAHAKRMLAQLPQANELLLARFRQLAHQLDNRDLTDGQIAHIGEEEREFWRTVGFHGGYESIDQLIEDLIQLVESWKWDDVAEKI